VIMATGTGRSRAALAEPQQGDAALDAAPPLFERIGGWPRVEWLADRFVDEILADPELAPAFARVDLASFKRSQAAFFTEAFGGRLPEAAADPRTCVHLEGDQLVRVALVLHDILMDLGLPDEIQDGLVLAVVSRVLRLA